MEVQWIPFKTNSRRPSKLVRVEVVSINISMNINEF